MKNDSPYWDKFYTTKFDVGNSSFSNFVLPYLKGFVVELGCGNGRDVYFFAGRGYETVGVDQSFTAKRIVNQDVAQFINENKSPKNVYTRFFWHSIPRKLQLAILKWTKDFIFIEARTLKDKNRKKVFPKHERNYIDVGQLARDLKKAGFEIISLQEGLGWSKFRGEDPHLVRVVARKLAEV